MRASFEDAVKFFFVLKQKTKKKRRRNSVFEHKQNRVKKTYLKNIHRYGTHEGKTLIIGVSEPVLRIRIRIRIHRIHMFLGLLDPDPSIIMQK
jgi:hypothetical protein